MVRTIDLTQEDGTTVNPRPTRSDHSDRDKSERIRRLKGRLDRAKAQRLAGADLDAFNTLAGAVLGTLDLLADEL